MKQLERRNFAHPGSLDAGQVWQSRRAITDRRVTCSRQPDLHPKHLCGLSDRAMSPLPCC
ncbi:hypothetical protein XACW160_90156 [Xanthomonas citri pv. citri]|nr:hypothetical protein XAC1083_110157 [Xanthomonas citri pv. citri]CEE23001.1 hypothetical protein XAC902_120025 [Xanthomonas citri pv. citri]CEE23845.1 hypothetical protein XAC2911_110160 [Xanthomonas citri pv. citri]CEE51305.1 hypothetical protein XAC71A_130156 [Xanthomonas citri pv. citri]CEE57225.1 hypothetical protein XAC2852_130156 [Xanthomonas citri pv. citri]